MLSLHLANRYRLERKNRCWIANECFICEEKDSVSKVIFLNINDGRTDYLSRVLSWIG